jgi:hypothetical protein
MRCRLGGGAIGPNQPVLENLLQAGRREDDAHPKYLGAAFGGMSSVIIDIRTPGLVSEST